MIHHIVIDSRAFPEAPLVRRTKDNVKVLGDVVWTQSYTYTLHHPDLPWLYYGSTDCVTHRRNGHHDKSWSPSADTASIHQEMRREPPGWIMTVTGCYADRETAAAAERTAIWCAIETGCGKFVLNETDPITLEKLPTAGGQSLGAKRSAVARSRRATPATRRKLSASGRLRRAAERLQRQNPGMTYTAAKAMVSSCQN